MKSTRVSLLFIATGLLLGCGGSESAGEGKTLSAEGNGESATGNFQNPLDGSKELTAGTWTDLTTTIVATCKIWSGTGDDPVAYGDELASFVVEVSAVNSGDEALTLPYAIQGLVGENGAVVEPSRYLNSRPQGCERDPLMPGDYPDAVIPGFQQTVWAEFGEGPSYAPNENFDFTSLNSVVLLFESPNFSDVIYYIKPGR
jgi:hypothetical protein